MLVNLGTAKRVIYLPAFNCEQTVGRVLSEIPGSCLDGTAILIIDNASTDQTIEEATASSRKFGVSDRLFIVRPHKNLGYAGSQKLAYSIACSSQGIESVVMLHGDGQYPAELLPRFFTALEKGADVAAGYRSASNYPDQEETPAATRFLIQSLSKLETGVTGVRQVREWHSGYIGYRTSLLRRIPLQLITETMHVDGHLLFAAATLGGRITAVPIYKKYRNLVAFGGKPAVKYVLTTLRLMFQMKKQANDIRKVQPLPMFTQHDFRAVFSHGNPARPASDPLHQL